VVVTKLNRPLLEKVASETGGLYLPSTPGEEEVQLILRHLETLGERTFKERQVVEKEDRFQLFLVLALLFLVMEMLIRRTTKAVAQPLAVLAAFFLLTGFIQTPSGLNQKGNDLFEQKKYQSAIDSYRKAQVKNPEDPTIRYNLATTLYHVDSYQESSKELERSIEGAQDKTLKTRALYNYGNTQYRLGNFEKAIEAYEQALEIDSKDEDAKYNLEFLQKKKSMFDKKNEDRKKDQKQDQQQQDQQQQQQQKQQQQQQEQDQQQQEQDQQQQEQDQKDQQEQQQQRQQEQDEKEGEQERQQQQDQQQREQEQQQKDREQREQEKRDQEREKEEEEKQPQPREGEEEREQPQEREQERDRRAPRPLQGQMTMDNALRILDALKETERELQDLRRPPLSKETPQVLKDW